MLAGRVRNTGRISTAAFIASVNTFSQPHASIRTTPQLIFTLSSLSTTTNTNDGVELIYGR